MLILAKKLHELAFGKLMEIYVEGNLENGQQAAPEEPVAQQIAIGEQNFYQYLNQVFFPTPEAVYAVWEENGQYISALRLETYRDGMLLEALETRPDYRRRGYAKKLIDAVLPYYPGLKIYSHVSRKKYCLPANPRTLRIPTGFGLCSLCRWLCVAAYGYSLHHGAPKCSCQRNDDLIR